MPSNDSAPPPDQLTRRKLLQRCGVASLALGAIAGSGCMGILSNLDSNRSEPIVVPPADSPDYRKWLPAPSALADDLDLDPGHVIHALPKKTGLKGLGGLFAFPEGMITARGDWFGYDYSHYERALMVDQAIVLVGEIDRSVVESAISETAYESAGTYEGYDLYDRADIRRTIAVGDGAIVFTSDEQSEANVKAVIDAAAGRIERYHETDEDFSRIVDASGGRPLNWFTPTDGDVIKVISATYDANRVYHVRHLLYPDESSVSEEELEREFESGGEELDLQALSVHSDGRLATVVQEFDRERYLDVTSVDDVPQVTWGIDYDENEEQVTIRHEAGDSIDAELLTIAYWMPGEPETADVQFADEYDTVEPGADLALNLSTREDVREIKVSYTPGESTWLLIDYRVR